MGYSPREHVCELFYFECMHKNDRNVKFTSKPYTDGDTLPSVV
jgi:hypothetical protein